MKQRKSMKFGAVFKKIRVLAGLSQEELAEKIYLSRSNVSRVENDKLILRLDDVIRWFQVTQAPEALAALLCGVDVNTVLQNITQILGGFIWLKIFF
ncbi:helix-turn-helix domain-containing protein [Bacillus chungangensis]|uniref:Transcriptional regulator with XRE-family HTH domain n=1 Tax=Bacillus chungangensis TaxID=587633 RepID=A0ABT9WS33_9BACI|nr:helix-turn-helix transcriptional regulator [Bacillus chungangensis]MDQ0176039.1 transcriptional regulator with XRE-family HTH domain [Bacillus chungangensis]